MNELLQKLADHSDQSRAILLIGKTGWGKCKEGLKFAHNILKTDPLSSADFFYFRNDNVTLKTEFYLYKKPNTKEAWAWLNFLQRRLNISKMIDETIIKVSTVQDALNEYITTKSFPRDEKFIKQLLEIAKTLNKKNGIPVNVIREAVKFHSVQASNGRVSIIADFDTADETTQNAALKLLEEPFPNHWLILTAENEKKIISTILSRTIKVFIPQPKAEDLLFLGNPVFPLSTTAIMEEELYQISAIKNNLLADFFNNCINQVDQNINFLQFIEKINKENHGLIFIDELLLCLEDALRLRQNHIRGLNLPVKFPQYLSFSMLFHKVCTAEIEEVVSSLEFIRQQISRSVIKAEALMIPVFLELARTLLRSR